jgi:heterodisulfide reductase subunit C
MDEELRERIAALRRAQAQALSNQDHVWSCPGCWSWQLHCTEQVAAAWSALQFADMVEDIVRDHVAHECTAPALVEFLWRQRGRPR